MGKIPGIEYQVKAPGPAASGSTAGVYPAGAATGSALQDLGQQLQRSVNVVQQRDEENEVSDLHVKLSQAQSDFTKDWQNTLSTADPGDKTLSDTFIQRYDEYTDKIREGVTTRAGQMFFDKENGELRSHFQRTADASQAELAGVKARQDFNSFVDNLGATLINDPSTFEANAGKLDERLNQLVAQGRIPQKAAIELRTASRQELAKNSIRGWNRLDPEGTQKALDGGRWDKEISGDLKYQLYHEGTQVISAHRAEIERQRLAQERAKKDHQNAVQTDFLRKYVKGDLSLNEIVENRVLDSFGSGSKQQLINMVMAENKAGGKIQKDSSRFMELFRDIHDGILTNESDLNEYVGDGLDIEWRNTLATEISGRKTEQGRIDSEMKSAIMKAAYHVLAKPDVFGNTDPDGENRNMAYVTHFLQEWEEKRAAGISARRMVDPKDKEYMGDKHMSPAYYRAGYERLRAMGEAMGGQATTNQPNPKQEAVPAPVSNKAPPNESPFEFLRRQRSKK